MVEVSWKNLEDKYYSFIKDIEKPVSVEKFIELEKLIFEMNINGGPYHLKNLINIIQYQIKDKNTKMKDISILDHGCGSGLALVYFLISGYKNIIGYEIGNRAYYRKLNFFLKNKFKHKLNYFIIKGDQTIENYDKKINVVYSLQVIEHLSPEIFIEFMQLEKKLIASSGILYHQIPHRLCPYEAHTKTWFVHYLNKKLRNYIYKKKSIDIDWINKYLFLKTNFFYNQYFIKNFGTTKNITYKRLKVKPDYLRYDGNIHLRQFLYKVSNFPIIGNLFIFLFKFMIMAEFLVENTNE